MASYDGCDKQITKIDDIKWHDHRPQRIYILNISVTQGDIYFCKKLSIYNWIKDHMSSINQHSLLQAFIIPLNIIFNKWNRSNLNLMMRYLNIN